MTIAYDYEAADLALAEARAALARGDHEACLTSLETAHRKGHDHARIHFAVHTTWLALAWKRGSARMALGQVAPILFAVPVSFVRRLTGT